jgi:hypothetical protein
MEATRLLCGGRRLAKRPDLTWRNLSILIALAHPCADKCWHQRLLWFVNGVREKPLEVSHGARLLQRLFRQISHESIAAVPRTIPLLAEPSVSMGNEPNATIAIWI